MQPRSDRSCTAYLPAVLAVKLHPDLQAAADPSCEVRRSTLASDLKDQCLTFRGLMASSRASVTKLTHEIGTYLRILKHQPEFGLR